MIQIYIFIQIVVIFPATVIMYHVYHVSLPAGGCGKYFVFSSGLSAKKTCGKGSRKPMLGTYDHHGDELLPSMKLTVRT